VAATPEGDAGVRNPFYARKAAKVARTGRILRERVSDEKRVEKPWEEPSIDGLTFEGVVRSGDIVLSVHDLAKTYNEKALFRDLTFVVRRGDRLVVRAANGSGKTTLVNIILGRVRPDSGTLIIVSHDRSFLQSIGREVIFLDLDANRTSLCSMSRPRMARILDLHESAMVPCCSPGLAIICFEDPESP
jgi:ATPase subunit of ABC transporter with duplicated ATPase domains